VRRRGHHVDVITSSIPGARPAANVIRLGRSVSLYANGSLARITLGRDLRRQMRATLHRGCYDVVHVHPPLVPTLPILAVEEAECPLVGTFHTYFERSIPYQLLSRYFQPQLDKLDAVIAVSQSAAAAHQRYFDASCTVIPNGIDVETFSPHVRPPPAFRRDVPTILFLGRLDPRNGLATLIRAFRQVRARGRAAHLVVVGDGPLRGHYRALANGDRDITFVGAVLEGRSRYYAHSAIYACPTTKASFGITLLEAMACATPIVCSDICGFREVVADGREALLTPRGDSGALADALVRLLDDEALRSRLGAAGRERCVMYSWTRVATQVLDIYARLLGRAASAA
jgi:phosphatidyl-myo-inositol alpha-mannosyltransferase